MQYLLDLFLHLDKHLADLTQQYGAWTYAILFAIVFCETGLVVTPILPGDSLLFAAGAIAALGGLNIWVLCGVLLVAAILGDTVNYHVGYLLGPKVLSGKLSRWLNPQHLERTQRFFNKYGAKTIVLARFVPIVRTLAPFMAGVGKMHYGRFLAYNVVGAIVWVFSMTWAGYLLGTIPFVQKNFEFLVLGIVAVSLLPAAFEFVKHRLEARRAGPAEEPAK